MVRDVTRAGIHFLYRPLQTVPVSVFHLARRVADSGVIIRIETDSRGKFSDVLIQRHLIPAGIGRGSKRVPKFTKTLRHVVCEVQVPILISNDGSLLCAGGIYVLHCPSPALRQSAAGTQNRKEKSEAEKLRSLRDRKSTRLNSSHLVISYAVF